MAIEVLRGYRLLKDFAMISGGRCKWTFAVKDGEEYFIKQYLSPRYPTADSPGSEKTKQTKRRDCEIFENHQQRLRDEIKPRVSKGGNVVFTEDFFREGPFYYKVTEKIDVSSLTPSEIALLPLDARLLIILTILSALRVLHAANIVHGDLKPDNILIKQKSESNFVAKLIDFDDSYFAREAPDINDEDEPEDIVGTLDYYSPELGAYVRKDGSVKSSDLGLESDIFALGIIFSQYLTGKKPEFDAKKHTYAWQAALYGTAPVLPKVFDKAHKSGSHKIDTHALANVINLMFHKDPTERPSLNALIDNIKAIKNGSSTTMPLSVIVTPEPPTTPTITGKLVEKSKEKSTSGSSDTGTAADGTTPPTSKLIIGRGFTKKSTDS